MNSPLLSFARRHVFALNLVFLAAMLFDAQQVPSAITLALACLFLGLNLASYFTRGRDNTAANESKTPNTQPGFFADLVASCEKHGRYSPEAITARSRQQKTEAEKCAPCEKSAHTPIEGQAEPMGEQAAIEERRIERHTLKSSGMVWFFLFWLLLAVVAWRDAHKQEASGGRGYEHTQGKQAEKIHGDEGAGPHALDGEHTGREPKAENHEMQGSAVGNVIEEGHPSIPPRASFGGESFRRAPLASASFASFVLDTPPFPCLAAGLSSSFGHPASVSAVFLCPQSGTPHLSGVGEVDGNTTPARAGNTVTGPNAQRTPGIGLDAISLNIWSMKAKKSKGAARPQSAKLRADASKQNLRLVLPCWVHSRTVINAHVIAAACGRPQRAENIDYLVGVTMTKALAAGDLLPEFEESRRALPDYRAGKWARPFTLALTLERATVREFTALSRAHGFTLHQGLSQALAWSAAHELAEKFAAFDPDADTAGEEWKGGAVS